MNGKGFAVIPVHQFGARQFAIRFRMMDRESAQQLGASLPERGAFASSGQIAIKFCPGCGAALPELIANNKAGFDQLLTKFVDT